MGRPSTPSDSRGAARPHHAAPGDAALRVLPGPEHVADRAHARASATDIAGLIHALNARGFAAPDPRKGGADHRLYGHIRPRKIWREVGELLRSLRARFRERFIVVLDDCSPHKKRELRARAAEHDIELVYLPPCASWLNIIESRFQALRRFALEGSDDAGHAEQGAAIHAYLRWHDRDACPARP